MIEREESHHMMWEMSALWEGHKDMCAEQGRAELERYPVFSFSRLSPLLMLWLRRGQVPLVASQSLRNASVADKSREGLPACGPLFFLTPSLLYFLFIVNLGNVLILNLIQKDINSQFGVTSLNLRKMGCDRWDFLFFRILTSKIFLSCFKLEVDINGMPSKDLYRQALLKICFFYF